jgi:hypothetical protein
MTFAQETNKIVWELLCQVWVAVGNVRDKVNIFAESDDVAVIGGSILEKYVVYGLILFVLTLKVRLV